MAALALGINTVRSTLTFKDYSANVSGRPLLGWVLQWLNVQNPKLRVAITCGAGEATAVRDIAGPATPVIVHDELTPVERLEAAAAACNATEVIAARLQVLLGPASQIKAVKEALGSGYGSVLVHGVPEGTAVEGYTLDVLRAFKSHALSGLPQAPRDLLNVLCAAASAAGDTNPFSWRHADVDSRNLYESAIDRPLPERIDFETNRQLARLAAILSSGLPQGDGLALLRRWQDSEVYDEIAELALGRATWLKKGIATAPSVALRTRKRRILYASVASAFSGAEEVACLLAEHLDKEQFTPYALISHEGLFTERLRQAGVSVICPGHDIGEGSLARMASTARIVADVRPSLIHAHGDAGLGVLMSAVGHNIPFVQHIHVQKLDSNLRAQCLAADQVIVVSRYVRERVVWAGVPDDRISVIYNGVRTPAADSTENRTDIRQRYGIPGDAAVLLMVGRYAERKRHDVFVRALSLVAAKGCRVYGVCVGDPLSGPDVYRRMLQLSRECGVGDRLLAPGFLPDPAQLYRAADVVVLPSEEEPFAMAGLEALAFGVPLITTTSGGLKEILTDGETAFLVGPADEGALAEKILAFLTQPAMAKSMAERGQRLMSQSHSASAFAEQVQRVYTQALAQNAAAQAVAGGGVSGETFAGSDTDAAGICGWPGASFSE